MKKAARFLVVGTVQGVFFRKFVKDSADDLKLTGFVRNLDTGEVEVVVEGEQDQIERLEPILKKGPKHAQIRQVKREEKKWSGEFKNFKIMKF